MPLRSNNDAPMLHSRIESMADQFECIKISRRTLFYLIATLNASFQPDYDFSNCRGDEFSKQPCLEVRLACCLPTCPPFDDIHLCCRIRKIYQVISLHIRDVHLSERKLSLNN